MAMAKAMALRKRSRAIDEYDPDPDLDLDLNMDSVLRVRQRQRRLEPTDVTSGATDQIFADSATQRWFMSKQTAALRRKAAYEKSHALREAATQKKRWQIPIKERAAYDRAVRRLEDNAARITQFAIDNLARLEDFSRPEHPVNPEYIATMLRLVDTVFKKAVALHPDEFTMDPTDPGIEKMYPDIPKTYLGDKMKELEEALLHVRYISFRELCEAIYENVELLRGGEYCVIVPSQVEKSNMLVTLLSMPKLRPRFAARSGNREDNAAVIEIQKWKSLDCLLFDDCIYSGSQMRRIVSGTRLHFNKCQVHCVPAFYHTGNRFAPQQLPQDWIHSRVRDAVLQRSRSLRTANEFLSNIWTRPDLRLTYLQTKQPDEVSAPTWLWSIQFGPFANSTLRNLFREQVKLEHQESLSIATNCKGEKPPAVISPEWQDRITCPYHWYRDVLRNMFPEDFVPGGRRRSRSRPRRSSKSRRSSRSRSRPRSRSRSRKTARLRKTARSRKSSRSRRRVR